MKVFEILRPEVKVISEQEVINRIQKFEWNYEFSDNFSKIARCTLELQLIENMVYKIWKKNPDNAIRIWNENCPQSPSDKTVTPSFILRLEAQDR